MRLFITGATGLVGRRLTLDRLERGDRVVLLSRRGAHARSLFAADANPNVEVVEGDPGIPGPWQRHVDGCDGVVHLAGAGIADRRWTTAYKQQLVNSRIDGTHQVVEAMAAAVRPPRVLVGASAVGWYGDTGSEPRDESGPSGPGSDFLVDLCQRWEREAASARRVGARVVHLRTGLVLDARGGLLAKLVVPFRWFVGGPIGLGRAYMPWIHWRDLIGIIDLALRHPTLEGPVNGCAPNPVTNRRFSRSLGRALGRPSWLPVPPPALRVVLGEFARYAVMSQRIVPAAAQAAGYRFVYPEVEPALDALLTPTNRDSVAAPGSGASPADQGPRPPVPIRLVAIGVDGTLLRSDRRVSQSVIRACRAAHQRGVVVVLASARPPRFTRGLVSALDIRTPTINYHGAVIWNPIDDRAQYHEPIDPEVARDVVATARSLDPDVLIAVEVLDRWYTDRMPPGVKAGGDRTREPDDIGPLEDYLSGAVTQIDLIGSTEGMARVRAAFGERLWKDGRISLFRDGPVKLQITNRMVDTGIALQRIVRRLDLARESVMAIGATAHDRGMIEWAGFGVATANAPEDVRRIADAVVPGNEDLGVALAMERYLTEIGSGNESGGAESGP